MNNENETAPIENGDPAEMPFWKGALWWVWGFTVGLIIGV